MENYKYMSLQNINLYDIQSIYEDAVRLLHSAVYLGPNTIWDFSLFAVGFQFLDNW